jgi:hypothetical protein
MAAIEGVAGGNEPAPVDSNAAAISTFLPNMERRSYSQSAQVESPEFQT